MDSNPSIKNPWHSPTKVRNLIDTVSKNPASTTPKPASAPVNNEEFILSSRLERSPAKATEAYTSTSWRQPNKMLVKDNLPPPPRLSTESQQGQSLEARSTPSTPTPAKSTTQNSGKALGKEVAVTATKSATPASEPAQMPPPKPKLVYKPPPPSPWKKLPPVVPQKAKDTNDTSHGAATESEEEAPVAWPDLPASNPSPENVYTKSFKTNTHAGAKPTSDSSRSGSTTPISTAPLPTSGSEQVPTLSMSEEAPIPPFSQSPAKAEVMLQSTSEQTAAPTSTNDADSQHIQSSPVRDANQLMAEEFDDQVDLQWAENREKRRKMMDWAYKEHARHVSSLMTQEELAPRPAARERSFTMTAAPSQPFHHSQQASVPHIPPETDPTYQSQPFSPYPRTSAVTRSHPTRSRARAISRVEDSAHLLMLVQQSPEYMFQLIKKKCDEVDTLRMQADTSTQELAHAREENEALRSDLDALANELRRTREHFDMTMRTQAALDQVMRQKQVLLQTQIERLNRREGEPRADGRSPTIRVPQLGMDRHMEGTIVESMTAMLGPEDLQCYVCGNTGHKSNDCTLEHCSNGDTDTQDVAPSTESTVRRGDQYPKSVGEDSHSATQREDSGKGKNVMNAGGGKYTKNPESLPTESESSKGAEVKLDPSARTFVPAGSSQATSLAPSDRSTMPALDSEQSTALPLNTTLNNDVSVMVPTNNAYLSPEVIDQLRASIRPEFRNICPHSLTFPGECKNVRCTMRRLCTTFNTLGLKAPRKCPPDCRRVHWYKSCEEEVFGKPCNFHLHPTQHTANIGTKRARWHNIRRVHEHHVSSTVWKTRVVLAGLVGSHYRGEYM
ncbi:hypothetical protein B0O99DRAFT_718920 [Bisporella sp. PMI_857]|nr:hypothetical protein B0O99DRAFT_718920 [Bisporella sp. PMI_857]